MEQMTLPTETGIISASTLARARLASPQPQTNPERWWVWSLRLLTPTLLGAGLLWLCYFPLSWGWLAWVALVPLLTLARSRARPWIVYGCAFLNGLVFFLAVLRWMPVADDRMYAPWAGLSIYCSLYFAVALFLIRWLERRTSLPLMLTAPVVWTALEYLRSFLMTGFAWYFLGHTQHIFLPLIQVCDLAGVYAVSFLLVAVNAWLFEVLYLQAWFRTLLGLREPADRVAFLDRSRWIRLAIQGGCVAILFGATLFYGMARLQQDQFQQGPRIALMQTNVDQRQRNTPLTKDNPQAPVVWGQILDHLNALQRLAADSRLQADLVVWPETSHPGTWKPISMEIPTAKIPLEWSRWQQKFQDEMRAYVLEHKKAVLFGLNTELLTQVEERETGFGVKVNVPKKWDRFNSALLVHGNGAFGQRYDKIHRVPFGEYVPLRDWLPFMNKFAPYDFDYSIKPGEKLTRFELDKYQFGVLICYEDTDPFLARQYGVNHRDGRAVDFLVNLSNDGWFDGSSEHEEHLALCRFRAIESRRAVARSVNMGISAIIDGNGRVQKPEELEMRDPRTKMVMGLWPIQEMYGQAPELPISEWAAKKKVPGVLVGFIPIDTRTSYYALWGDWLPIGCWSLLGVVLAWSLVSRQFKLLGIRKPGAD